MRIVVTGASGNIGTALLRTVAPDGWEVTGVARRRPDPSPPYGTARWVECDLATSGAVPALTELFAGADAVVHLAWAIHPRRDEPPFRRTNAAGSAHVLQAAEQARVPHLVCASSVAAYRAAGRWRRVDESWPCDGVAGSAYSAGKSAFESELDAFTRRNPGTRVARIRPSAVIQNDAAALFRSWLLPPWMPRRLLGFGGLPLPLWPGLRLQIVHADDVALAIQAIVTQQATGAYNVASDPVLERGDLAKLVNGILLPLPLSLLRRAAYLGWRLGLQPLHPGWMLLDDRAPLVRTDRLRHELGWSPRHDVRSAMVDLIAAMRSGHEGGSPPLRPGRRSVVPGRPSHQDQAP